MGDGFLLASVSKQVTCGRNIGLPLLQVCDFFKYLKEPYNGLQKGETVYNSAASDLL